MTYYHCPVLHLCARCYARFWSHQELQRHQLASHRRHLAWHNWPRYGGAEGRLAA
jgi:hypothetical protein